MNGTYTTHNRALGLGLIILILTISLALDVHSQSKSVNAPVDRLLSVQCVSSLTIPV